MKKGLKVLSIAALTLLLGSCTNAVVENQIQTQIKREEIKINEENLSFLDHYEFDYVIDAIDDISAKVLLIKYLQKRNNFSGM